MVKTLAKLWLFLVAGALIFILFRGIALASKMELIFLAQLLAPFFGFFITVAAISVLINSD